jgi:Tol biopolymer transport system component/DNA-binding winged helix-turn-helix (wHTH) protein
VNDQSNEKICFADFEIDTAHRLLRRRGETLALNAKAFDLLAFLARNAGRVIFKNEILDAVWEDQFVEEANLKVQISALRKVLGERKDDHRFLVTVPGKGYKFVADTRNGNRDVVIETHKVSHFVVEPESEIGNLVSTKEAPAIYGRGRSKIPLLLTGIAVIALIAVVGGFWYFSRNSNVSAVPPDAPTRELTIKKLTNQGRVNRVKLSPDGKFFAYTLRERGSYRTEFRLGQTDGGSDALLRPVSDISHYPISFSPDGNWIYYVEIPPVSEYSHSNGAFYKMPVLPGVPQKLNDSASVFAVLSPDEKQIAFPRRTSHRSSIVIADLDGTNEREVAIRPPDQFIDLESLSWSAENSIAFSAAAGHRRNDSSKRTFEVFVVRLEDGSVRQVTQREWNRITPVEWLKDGAGLVAVASSSEQLNTSSLWLIDSKGEAQRLSRDVNRYAWLSVAADSTTLATVQSQHETNIWLALEDKFSAATQITHSSSGRQDGWYGTDWTPDGRILYTAWIGESLTIWVMDANGENSRQLTSIGFRDERPVATADGKFVVFESNRSGTTEIWRMEIDGSNLQRLTADGGNSHASVTPDGRWVIYRHVNEPKSSLWRVSLNGGESVLIVDKDIDVPRVSPDGKLIACSGSFDGETKVAVYPVEGGEPLKLFRVPKTPNFRYWLNWSPDGKFISYPDAMNGIWMQSLDGGEPTRLEGIPVERTFSYAWSRDGKQFALGRQRETRDAVLIRDFR